MNLTNFVQLDLKGTEKQKEIAVETTPEFLKAT